MAKVVVPITVGGRVFPTKTALLKECSRILRSSAIGTEDERLLADLIERHPERDLKVGCGVSSFFVASDGYGGVCFWILRADGTKTDFSFRACVTAPSHEADVKRAFRQAIEYQIIAIRDAEFAGRRVVPCAITGRMVTSEQAHVDHTPPDTFAELVARFMRFHSLSFDQIGVNQTADGDTKTRIADPALRDRWERFHMLHVHPRITFARANVSQGSGRK